MSSVLWFQAGACSGNTMSFLNAEEPNVVDLIVDFGLEVAGDGAWRASQENLH